MRKDINILEDKDKEEVEVSIKRVTHNSIVDALDAILRSLYNYEQKFHIPSDEFYRGYLEGKFEDTKDFVEWVGIINTILI